MVNTVVAVETPVPITVLPSVAKVAVAVGIKSLVKLIYKINASTFIASPLSFLFLYKLECANTFYISLSFVFFAKIFDNLFLPYYFIIVLKNNKITKTIVKNIGIAKTKKIAWLKSMLFSLID